MLTSLLLIVMTLHVTVTSRHGDVRHAAEGDADVRDDSEDDRNQHEHVHEGYKQHGQEAQQQRQHGLALALRATNAVFFQLTSVK